MEQLLVVSTLLSGIIYLHRITDNRKTHASMRILTLFRKLCGENNLSNVLLVTNRWGVCDREEAEREKELMTRGSFWATMLARGAKACRYSLTTQCKLDSNMLPMLP